jgi:hypothetical protein
MDLLGVDHEDGSLMLALSTTSSTAPAPLCIDLFCGLGGWTEGFLSEGFDVVGFDIEQHIYGEHRYPAQLVIQDVRTIHGSQFKDADIIVASSPCQEFSYRAMPWKRAKALGPPVLGMELFAQAGRIQKEACEAAGRYIPMIQENVRGAQKYVGRAQWHYGSYYLWGDIPALMPITTRRIGDSVKAGDRNKGREEAGMKNTGGSWFNVANNTTSGHGQNPDGRLVGPRGGQVRHDPRYPHLDPNAAEYDGVKQGGDWFNAASLGGDGQQSISRRSGSKSKARKAASARIAKIPFPLAQWIARVTRESRKVA